ncbi:hypothetical protein LUZ60_002339 [Juncus effusus]|nr:hypothetical protein LUZ60_002339 [Juncus effusus]
MKRVPLHHLLSRRRLSTAELGFQRPEFGREKLVGTVQPYERHVFLRYGSPDTWHADVEAHEGLPRSLSMAIKARKTEIEKKTRLTIYQEGNCSDSSDGDVLIFPDMVKYRKLTDSDINKFVEEVLVKETKWNFNHPENIQNINNNNNSYIFVCSHGARDARCGFCGPVLIEKFQDELDGLGLADRVFVGHCSHIGGHKYAGNVVIFGSGFNHEAAGHWYGYVSPDEVKNLVEQHIIRGIIVEKLWRGQMGLSKEDQKRAQNLRFQLNSKANQAKQG